jgi:hypothetical protein
MEKQTWWSIIQENYLKLDKIKNSGIYEGDHYDHFMATMDYYTNAFINQLDLDNYEDGFADECRCVSVLLKQSLTEPIETKKIRNLLKAYKIMIDIGTQVRKQIN